MSRTVGRRPALLAGLSLLGGCGFHPLLAPGSAGSKAALAQLRTVFVPVMPERSGQLFREALQARLAGTGPSVAKRYQLNAPFTVSLEGLSIQQDTSTSRFRMTGSTSWSLLELAPPQSVVTTGYARLLDGYDNINQQYLSTAFESEAATRRLADNLADRVVQQLAIYFDRPA